LGGGGAREFRESREQFFGRGTAYVTIMIAAKIVFVTGEQSCVLDFGGGAVHKLGGGRSKVCFYSAFKGVQCVGLSDSRYSMRIISLVGDKDRF